MDLSGKMVVVKKGFEGLLSNYLGEPVGRNRKLKVRFHFSRTENGPNVLLNFVGYEGKGGIDQCFFRIT